MRAHPLPAQAQRAEPAPPTPLTALWRDFSANKGALAGLMCFALIVICALFADQLAPFDPIEQYRDALLVPPWWSGGSSRFLLGTDEVGRDILSRLLHGARLSLLIGAVAVLLSMLP